MRGYGVAEPFRPLSGPTVLRGQPLKLPGIFRAKRKPSGLPAQMTERGASHGAVIGVPACTARQSRGAMVNEALLLLAKKIPAGGLRLVAHEAKYHD